MATQIPAEILQWVQSTYPNPQIDQEWLHACLHYLTTSLHIPLPPAGPLQPVLDALDTQLLRSDLGDSMLPGTGLPRNVGVLNDVRLRAVGREGGVLVEIVAITEIASSAFHLMGVKKAREERGVVSLDANEDQHQHEQRDEEEDEGPIQPYPRGMLRLELSDGAMRIKAVEYRSIPGLELGVTPLGFKLLLKSPLIRRGIAFLEPSSIELLGGSNTEREENQWVDFERTLAVRMGKEYNENEGVENPPVPPAHPPQPQHHPPHPQNHAPHHQPNQPNNRPPFRDLSPPASPGPSSSHIHDDDVNAPRRRKVPNTNLNLNTLTHPNATQNRHHNAQASGSGPTRSTYFSDGASGSSTSTSMSTNMEILSRERILSPTTRSTTGAILVLSTPSPPPPPAGTRRIARLPTRSISNSNSNSASTSHPVAPRGGTHKKEGPSTDFDSDYFGEDDMFMDDAVLEELHLIEVEASASGVPASTSTNTNTNGGSSVSGSGSGSGARPMPVPPSTHDPDIIIIDSEEEEDKENVPVPTRHVRRRTQQPRTRVVNVDDDVIDISSSE